NRPGGRLSLQDVLDRHAESHVRQRLTRTMPTSRRSRLLALLILICLIGLAWWWVAFTESGCELTADPHAFAQRAHGYFDRHAILAPIVIIVLYVVLTVLALLPVWWLQVLAGFAFGTWMGVIWCDIAAALGAIAATWVSRWLAADWFHRRV